MIENRDTRLPLPRGPYPGEVLYLNDPKQAARHYTRLGMKYAALGLASTIGLVLTDKYGLPSDAKQIGLLSLGLPLIPFMYSMVNFGGANAIKNPTTPFLERKRNEILGIKGYRFKWPEKITERMRKSCTPQIEVYPQSND